MRTLGKLFVWIRRNLVRHDRSPFMTPLRAPAPLHPSSTLVRFCHMCPLTEWVIPARRPWVVWSTFEPAMRRAFDLPEAGRRGTAVPVGIRAVGSPQPDPLYVSDIGEDES